MISTAPQTFIEIFTTNPEGHNDTLIKRIVIPIIQRDYAQGRENETVNRVRSRFLNALREALVDDHPITLDFIYGEIEENGNLIPLDGQQRLTTLFLLHWYVSKHEDIEEEKCFFLKNFSYDTRYSAREFCSLLTAYTPDFNKDKLSDDIRDQYWFPMSWENDPTIASMLVMIDAIHAEFRETSGLWEKLENGAIAFYFLSLKDMGLTDELYIKMNSRGKPLTQFEHFKAELEGAIKSVDEEIANRISRKIDLTWTDMLWPYRGDNQIIDDEFVRYFHFICDLINYMTDSPLIDNPFEMVKQMFSKSNHNAKENILYIEKLFDCWSSVEDIDDFFDKYLTTGEHCPQKSIVGKTTNLFRDCCNVYGEMQDTRIRRFPIGRSILLYSFILYLLHKDTISEECFIRRLRVINNLVRASEFELRDDRMKTLLSQTEEIIVFGEIEVVEKSFNINQLKEEVEKFERIAHHPEEEDNFRLAEDHPLLNGAVRVLGVDSISIYPRFEQLFNCDWDLVDRALLATGDYSRFIRWRYQIGSSKLESVWRSIFNTSEDEMCQTKEVLGKLLISREEFNDEALEQIIDSYLASSPILDWRCYLVKYQSMRPARYGMYWWPGDGKEGKKYRKILMMTTEKSISNGKNYNIFLKTLYDKLHQEFPDLYLGNYAYQHDGDKLIIGGNKAISCDDAVYTIYNILEGKTYEATESIPIPQDESGTNDIQDRIEIGESIIRKMYS